MLLPSATSSTTGHKSTTRHDGAERWLHKERSSFNVSSSDYLHQRVPCGKKEERETLTNRGGKAQKRCSFSGRYALAAAKAVLTTSLPDTLFLFSFVFALLPLGGSPFSFLFFFFLSRYCAVVLETSSRSEAS